MTLDPHGPDREASVSDPAAYAQELRTQLDELQRIAHIGSWQWHIRENRVTWTDELYRIYGLEPNSIACSFESYLERVHEDDRMRVRETIAAALERGRSFDFHERIVRPDGEVRTLRSRGRVLFSGEGEPVRMLGTCQDVTEQVAAAEHEVHSAREQGLRLRGEEEEKRASFLAEAAMLLASSLDYETTLDSLASLAVSRIADWCAIDVESPSGELERLVTAHPDPAKRELAQELHRRYPPDPEAPGGVAEVMRTGESILAPSISAELIEAGAEDEEHLRLIRELHLVSYMIVPLRSSGRTFGAITFVSAETGENYGPDDLRLAQELADRAGLAVENARLYREQKRTLEALRYSETRYRSLVEAAAAIVWTATPEGELDGEQAGWSAYTGQTPDAYRGTGWLDAVHPDDRQAALARWTDAVRERSKYESEHRLLRHDGEYRHMLARGVPLLDDAGEVREWFGLHTDVTALRRAREALEHQSYVTRTITENVTAGLFMTDARGRCTYMNAAAETMTGFTVAELGDTPLHDAIHHHRPDGSPFPIEACPIERALPENFTIRAHDDFFIRRDGTFFPVVCAASPIFDGAEGPVGTVVEVRDMTAERTIAIEREKLVQERELERERLQEIFRRAPAFIATLTGPDHVFESANPHYLELVGRKDVIGRTVAEVLPEVVEQGFIQLLDRVYGTGEPFVGTEVPVVLHRGDGGDAEERFVNFVYQPIYGAGSTITGIFVHGVDVTVHVRSRQEVESKAEELAELARRLETSNRELDQFAYVASHDLKAPLRGIANLSQWIEEDLGKEVPAEVREQLDLLRGRVGRMEGLIDGILLYSRAGRTREHPERVDVAELIAEVLDLLAPPEGVNVEIGPGMPVLETEKLPLQQVLLNLLGNALKYRDVEAPRIRVDVEPTGGFHHFTVADNGPGIAPEFHERIFGIFQTLAARDKVEGTGIGLSLVKKIVENRGGRVWVESEEGAGATFHFLWPSER